MKISETIERFAVPAARIGCLTIALLAAAPARGQVLLGQTDDFETGLSNWTDGGNSPNPPTIAAGLGPGGAGDDAMRVRGNGVNLAAGRAVVAFNQFQWRGDFLSEGITSITMDLNNVGATALKIRLAFLADDFGTWFASSSSFDIPAGSGWQAATFSLAEGDLVRIQGTATHAETFQNVIEARILHSNSPDFRGATIAGDLLVDNITAVPEPATARAAAAWGLAAFGVASWLAHRRRAG